MSEKIFEITHDSLAAKIWEKVSAEDRSLLEVKNFIASAYKIYEERGVLLSKKDMLYVTPYLEKIKLSINEERFIKRSRKYHQRQRVIFSTTVILSFLLLATGLLYINDRRRKAEVSEQAALKAKQEAIKAKEEAENNFKKFITEQDQRKRLEINRLFADAVTYIQGEYYLNANKALDTILTIDKSNEVRKRVEDLKSKINAKNNAANYNSN